MGEKITHGFESTSTSTKDETSLAHGDIGCSFVEERGEGQGIAVRHVRPRLLSKPKDAANHGALGRKPRKTKLAIMGINRTIVDQAEPSYRNAVIQANSYRKARARELCNVFGYVSSGVSALLATASLAMASSRYLYEKVALTRDDSCLKQASALADSARQNELAAWELCSRESIAHKKAKMQEQGVPWLRQDGGEEKRGPKPATTYDITGPNVMIDYVQKEKDA